MKKWLWLKEGPPIFKEALDTFNIEVMEDVPN
jgi:hypothetical protein